MARFARAFSVGMLVALGCTAQARAQAPERQSAGWLEARVLLVTQNLDIKPVPKKAFRIDCVDEPGLDCGLKEAVVTSFEGTFKTSLSPGNYVLASVTPIEFEGKSYEWSIPFEVRPGETVSLELSNDNAAIQDVASAETLGGAPVPSEGTIFRKVRPSVFKVISEAGHGSGFLVDPGGLVLTNHHVVAGSDYLAVKIDEKRKYPAILVAQDPKNDIAVLRLHPDAVAGIDPVLLADDRPDRAPVSVGERVLAIGSPLATERILTTGIVSKVEEGAIYSDVNINAGNSGGPLFSMLGEAVGINTFGISGSVGPGVSGIVRIHLAFPAMAEARAKLGEEPPPDRRLPVESDFRFPADRLRELALKTEYDPAVYHVEAGKIDVQVITPVVLASLEVQGEKAAAEGRGRRAKEGSKEYEPGKDFYEWRRYAGDYRSVVRIQAIPEVGMTGGSIAAAIIGGLAGASGMPMRYKFKTDFERMELTRDGVVVEPIQPGRAPQVINMAEGVVSMDDVAYYGNYEYPPEAFRPDAKVVLKIWEQGKPKPEVRQIPPSLLNRIWWDFTPYFEALEAAVTEKPVPEE